MTEERHNEAAEIVQAAALEAIKAMKAFLDVAEAVVREPSVAATVGKAFAEAASSAFRSPHPTNDETTEDEDAAEPTGRVRRIDLSD
jgi:hypothetical protein